MMKIILPLLLLTLPCSASADVETLDTQEQRVLYTLGVVLMKDLAVFRLNERDLAILQQGMRDALVGELLVNPNDFEPQIQELAQARLNATKKSQAGEAAAFLATAVKKTGAKKGKAGLIIRTLRAGNGPSPTAESTVKVHYEGRLVNGTIFDASINRGEPLTMPLTRAIKCWFWGLQLMKVGEKAELICPPEIAYGDTGAPPAIPPGATLVFDIELLEIK